MEIKIIEDNQSQKTFEITAQPSKIDKYFKQGAKNLSTRFSIPGFRSGNAPFHIVAREVGDKEAYKEVINLALNSLLPDFFAKQKLTTLGEPEIEVLKIAPGNPFVFKIIISIYPEFTIPSLTDIKVKSSKIFVSDKEVDNSLEYLKKARNVENIDDKFAKSLGNFKNLEELKKSMRNGIEKDKEQIEKNKNRIKVLESISKKIKTEIAPILIKRESQVILNQHKNQVNKAGVKWGEYLRKMKKTEDELIKEQKDLAKMKIINSLILAKIAKDKSIKVERHEVNQRLEFILSKNNVTIDKLGKDLNIDQLKSNISQQILNEKIFTQILDKQIISS
ncbi:MAG: Trigger factor [Parcubacteria group bacterium GW2011_GWA2_31_28]|nr:MAG: Trigger factor [Parcubacteria group bacterium GW2011_GWA2_31_28]